MAGSIPAWLSLLSPLPGDARPESSGGDHVMFVLETSPDGGEGESKMRSAENRPPTHEEIAALRRLVEDVLSRR